MLACNSTTTISAIGAFTRPTLVVKVGEWRKKGLVRSCASRMEPRWSVIVRRDDSETRSFRNAFESCLDYQPKSIFPFWGLQFLVGKWRSDRSRVSCHLKKFWVVSSATIDYPSFRKILGFLLPFDRQNRITQLSSRLEAQTLSVAFWDLRRAPGASTRFSYVAQKDSDKTKREIRLTINFVSLVGNNGTSNQR